MEREPVRDININNINSFNDLLNSFNETSFSAKQVYEASIILKEMLNVNCIRFLSFTANLISTGLRGIIKDLAKEKKFDIIITTCGALDHDISRTFKDYYHGTFEADDIELEEKNIHRLGNVFIPVENHGPVIEKIMQEVLKEQYDNDRKELSTYELCWELGKKLKDNSFLYWAYKNKIPVIVPGITDGAVGYQLWQFSQLHNDFRINVLADEQLLNDIVWQAKKDNTKTGALCIGGGISKHHTIWWGQFANGFDYAVYVTTAGESDGSLSGAKTHEAISWGKIKGRGKYTTVEGDATIILPLLMKAVL